jgi:hypothetical protein
MRYAEAATLVPVPMGERLSVSRWRTKHFQSAQAGRGSGFDAELIENFEDMFFNRGPQALALYLLLVTVADAQGLSYYSDKTAARLLSLNEAQLREARRV